MIMSMQNKWLFVSVPKTGTHTMYELLKSSFGGIQLEGPYHRTEMPQECSEFFTFTTVRHPFSRTVSIWNSLTRVEPYRSLYLPVLGSDDFSVFVDCLIDGRLNLLPTGKGKALLTSQTSWLNGISCDRHLQIEKIDDEFSSLPFTNKINFKIPHLLHREHERWEDLCKGNVGVKLYDFLREDFKNFGYD